MNLSFGALTAGCGMVAVTAAVFFVLDVDSTQNGEQLEAAQVATTQFGVTQGMVVVKDQESGALRAPTAEEAASFQAPVQRSKEALPVVRRADGSESMKLDDRYITYSTVERRADGSWSQQCSLDHDHMQHAQREVK